MIATGCFSLLEVQVQVCDIASRELGISRAKVFPESRLLEDLGCDSLDLIDLFMDLEEAFAVILPVQAPNPVYKAVFTRQSFCLADLAELIYLQQGTGAPDRRWRRQTQPAHGPAVPFAQLSGVWKGLGAGERLLEPLASEGPAPQFRRCSDGMRCVLIAAASVQIGSDALHGETPAHVVHLAAFLMDAEPVSTTAYCRFLNSIGPVSNEILADWFVLDPQDDRNEHMVVSRAGQEWQPVPGTERWPMILVSWYGANAYSLWANGGDWANFRDEGFLPTEAQWEYAARGACYQDFPWGKQSPSPDRMRYGQHARGAMYRADSLPMADVNERLGMSPFGLHHMAGNVWQWCRDWYEEDFYKQPEARVANPVNQRPSKVRVERGGSWVGLAELCRSSYRRGRPPLARGRCLGFRCVSSVEAASEYHRLKLGSYSSA